MRAVGTAWLVAALLGCAGVPGAPQAGIADPAVDAPLTAAPSSSDTAAVVQASAAEFEARQRAHALALERSGALAEAALAWEVLLTLDAAQPADAQHLAALQQRIEHGVAQHLHAARQARADGELDRAARHYLAALALDPGEREAADALRAIERGRGTEAR